MQSQPIISMKSNDLKVLPFQGTLRRIIDIIETVSTKRGEAGLQLKKLEEMVQKRRKEREKLIKTHFSNNTKNIDQEINTIQQSEENFYFKSAELEILHRAIIEFSPEERELLLKNSISEKYISFIANGFSSIFNYEQGLKANDKTMMQNSLNEITSTTHYIDMEIQKIDVISLKQKAEQYLEKMNSEIKKEQAKLRENLSILKEKKLELSEQNIFTWFIERFSEDYDKLKRNVKIYEKIVDNQVNKIQHLVKYKFYADSLLKQINKIIENANTLNNTKIDIKQASLPNNSLFTNNM